MKTLYLAVAITALSAGQPAAGRIADSWTANVDGAADQAPAGNGVTVELWRGGDDGATILFTEGLEASLRASGFAIAVGNEPRTDNTLVVTVPTHLRGKTVGKRTKTTWVLEFAGPTGRSLGRRTGSCWRDALSVCTRDAARETVAAAKRLRAAA
jgi:hypothetical protein